MCQEQVNTSTFQRQYCTLPSVKNHLLTPLVPHQYPVLPNYQANFSLKAVEVHWYVDVFDPFIGKLLLNRCIP